MFRVALVVASWRIQQAVLGAGPFRVNVDWSRLPDRPVGTQDSLSGVLNGSFFVALGNRGVDGAPRGMGQGGMWDGGHVISTAAAGRSAVWRPIAAAPPTASESNGAPGVSVSGSALVTGLAPESGLSTDGLVVAGGYSHTMCSNRTLLLRSAGSGAAANASWTVLPDLPYEMSGGGLAVDDVTQTLYRIGGADCGLPGATERFSTWADRWGANLGFGRRVLSLSLAACLASAPGPSCRWRRVNRDFPGAPRTLAAVATVGRGLYVLGGVTYANATPSFPVHPGTHLNCTSIRIAGCTAGVSDSWRLDLDTMLWTRLPDRVPAVSPGGTNGVAVWRGRYIIAAGVLPPGRALSWPVGGLEPANGTWSLNTTCSPPLPGWPNSSNSYPNRIDVFDTKTHTYGTVTSSSSTEPGLVTPGCPGGLPINCFSPQVGVTGDALFVSGGECDPRSYFGGAAKYWHYPRIALNGKLSLQGADGSSDY